MAAEGDKEFSYIISDSEGHPYVGKAVVDGEKADVKGMVIIPAGKTAVIKDMPAGEYTVEQNTPDVGCKTELRVDEGKWQDADTVKLTISADGKTAVEYRNTYTAGSEPDEKEYFDLRIKNTVKGEGADKDDKFSIRVTFDAKGKFKTSNGDKIESGDRITLKGGESLTIYNLPAGTEYKVRVRNADEDDYKTSYSRCSGELTEDTTARITNTWAGKTDDKEDDKDGEIAKTGDNANTSLYIMLMVLSAAVVTGAGLTLRKRFSSK
ncbi:MAG: DUF7601 domain-containing protein [Candidatus Fimadaptatus sp.]